MTGDLRYTMVNSQDALGKKILDTARRAATGRLEKRDASQEVAKLRALLEPLDTGRLNILAIMLVISPAVVRGDR